MSFDKRHADTVLKKLDAETKNSHHKQAVVRLTDNIRIRLYRSHGRGSQPRFIEHRWRKDLHLTPDEFRDLYKCPLNGPAALKLIRERYGV